MLDLKNMTEEQLKEVYKRAEEALVKYQKDPVGNCMSAYDIMRYARVGIYEVKK